MEKMRKLPLNFFEKSRPSAPKNSLKDIIPIKWSDDVLSGKKQVIVSLPKKESGK